MQDAERVQAALDIIKQRRTRTWGVSCTPPCYRPEQLVQSTRLDRRKFRMLAKQKLDDLLIVVGRLHGSKRRPAEASCPKCDVALRQPGPSTQ